MAEKHYEALVIGAGPGGYAAAIRLGQLDKKTLIIEKEAIGGTCLNFGCVPSKALISAAERYHKLDHSEAMGISVKQKSIDFSRTQEWKGEVVGKLTGGVAQLLKGNGVDTLEGTARFKDAHSVIVDTGEGEEKVTFDKAIIATGSRPFFLKGFEPDGEVVVGSRDALDFEEVPEKLLVIGGGYIGLELGIAYAKLGTDVKVVEMMDSLLPVSPKRLAKMVERSCKKLGMDIHLKTKAQRLEKSGKKATLIAEDEKGEEKRFEADRVLVTIGRKPVTDGLELEAAGLKTDDRGFIPVDAQRRTEVEHIFAIGDVAGEPMLAHKASKEGVVAAEVIAGESAEYDHRAVPAVIFTEPEVAYVGLSPEEAKEEGYEVVTGRFPFQANGRALALDETDGWVQVIGDRESGRLLGVQIVGPEAADLISEACLALEMGARLEDVGYTMHPHPTLGEAVMEAAEGALGKAIHQLNR